MEITATDQLILRLYNRRNEAATPGGQTIKILAICYGAAHVNIVLPVARELKSRGHEVSILALTTAYQSALASGFPVFQYRDFLTEEDAPALELGRKLAAHTPPHPSVDPEESIAYLGINMAELIANYGEDRAALEFRTRGRQAFLPVDFMRRILRVVRPDRLLVTNSPRSERAATIAAQSIGIPVAVVLNLPPDELKIDWLKTPGHGNRLCAPSEGARDDLIRAGRRPEEVVTTGNPAFDELALQNAAELRNRWRIRHRIGPDQKAILFASQPDANPQFGLEISRGLEAALDPCEVLVVRPHPNEMFDVAELSSSTRISSREDPLKEALFGCDSCVVVCSTVGLQAALIGRPVVVLLWPTSTTAPVFHKMGIAESAETCAEAMIRARTAQPKHASGWKVGGSAARVADVLETLSP